MNFNPIFKIDTDNHGTIDWQYANSEKIFHKTWIVKRKDIILLCDLSQENKKEILDELMIEIEKDNQMVKDRNNKLAKERRVRGFNV